MEPRGSEQRVVRLSVDDKRTCYYLAIQGIGLLIVALTLAIIFIYRGGFGYRSYPKLEFNWHYFLTVLGFTYFFANELTIYRLRPILLKTKLKLIHLGGSGAVIICTLLGLFFVIDEGVIQEYKHFQSLHSWIGIFTAVLLLIQLLDTSLPEPWTSGSLFGNPVSPLCSAAALAAPIWRTSSRTSNKVYPYYTPTPEDTCVFQEMEGDLGLPGTATANPHGTISLRLAHKMRVDLTVDRAVRLLNFKHNIVIAMNPTGSACALLHPNGRVHQWGSRVEIMAHDMRGNHKYAKMWYKGVSFTSENCALVYLVDSAGTRTTTDTFSDLTQDFSLGVFYSESRHGQTCGIETVNIIQGAQYWTTEEGVENWIINNVRISQAPDGLVRVARNSNKYQLRTSPTNGTASMTTPFLHCTASMGSTSHLFVRRGERRMHFDGSSFIVRNAGHSAGFDEKTQLKVF